MQHEVTTPAPVPSDHLHFKQRASAALRQAKETLPRLPISPRAFIIGLAIVALLSWATPYNDYLVGATLMAGNYLPVGGFLMLTLLIVVINGLIRTVKPKLALRPVELVVIWCMIATASSIPGSGLMRSLIPYITAPTYYASPENQWEKRLLVHMPDDLLIRDQAAVKGFFERSPDGAVPWGQWFTPLFCYGLFVIPLYISFFCLSTLLRRQWVEHERFTFPLVQFPAELVQSPKQGHKLGPVWYKWSLWIPVIGLTLIHTLNGLQKFYPALPQVNLYHHPIQGIAGRPFNVLNGVRYPIYPLVVGFGFLLKREVLLSLWFFYLFLQGERVIASALGLSPARTFIGYGSPAFASQQAAGMALGLTFWIVYSARGYFRDIWRQTFTSEHPLADSEEAMPLRWALTGWLISMAIMFTWLVYFGGDALSAFFTMLFGTVAYVVLAWMVAQGGVLFLQSPWSGAEMGVNLLGFRSFTPRGVLVSNEIEGIVMLDLREFSLPHLLDDQKFTDTVHVTRRGLMVSVAVAMLVAIVISGNQAIRLPYQYGASMMYDKWAYVSSPQRPLNFLSQQLSQPLPAQPGAWENLAAGLVGFWVLMMAQTRLIGFPVHPAGFIFASGYPLACFWFSFLLAWVLKTMVLRYGGLKRYQNALPFFYGLILGDVLNGGVWIIIGLLTRKAYTILPG